MPIKDEELRKIIKILVDKDKEKKAKKKGKKKRRRATGGAVAPGGQPSTATFDSAPGIGGRPGSLMGGWGSSGGGGGGGSLGPTRQEIQNMIQSNLITPSIPLAVPQPPSALPPSLASANIFDMPERNILTRDEETNTPEIGAKWTYDELMDDSFGNFAGGTAGDEFLDPEQVPAPAPYGAEENTSILTGDVGADIKQEDIPPEEAIAEEPVPVVISPSKPRKPRRSPEEMAMFRQEQALKADARAERAKSKLGKKYKPPPTPDTSIYNKRTPVVSYAPDYETEYPDF